MGLLNVNEFKQKISKPAVSSRYEVEIGLPTFLQGKLKGKGYSIAEINNNLKFLVNSTTIPSMNISTTKVYHRGNPFVIRGALSFSDDWKISFYNTSDMFLHNVFMEWMYAIDQYDNLITKTQFLANYVGFAGIGAGYMNDAKLYIKNGDGSTETTYKISYIFPVEVSEVELNSQEQGSLTSTNVRFAYTMFKKWDGIVGDILNSL